MKKLIAFVLTFVMVFAIATMPVATFADEATTTTEATATTTTTTTGEFTDVPATSKYKEAIKTLSNMGILLGDAGSNTFRPEAGITRAEFSVIIARLKGYGSLNVPVAGFNVFSDVQLSNCDEWKVKAIKFAYDIGVISGMGDGTFLPDNPVTYEQAVKMLVCFLNYKPLADKYGGWPDGYIVAGGEIQLTKNAASAQSEPAPRQVIAQLVYNALSIPVLGSGEGNKKDETVMDSFLKAKEGEGIVTAIKGTSLKGENLAVKTAQVEIDFDKIYNVGATNVEKYLGKSIEFIYTEGEDEELTLSSVTLKNVNNDEVFKADNIAEISGSEIKVYTDEEQEEYNVYSVDSNAYLIYNGKPAPFKGKTDSYINSTYKPYSGDLTAIDNDGDNKIDVIIIEDSKPFVVADKNSTDKILYNAYDGSTIQLKENSSTDVVITRGGAEIEFDSIGKTSNNVLLVSQSLNDSGKKYIKVEVVTKTAKGKIVSLDSSTKTVTVGSKDYKVADACWTKYKEKFNLNSEVTVYLDNSSRIIYVTTASVATKYTYGYLMHATTTNKGLSSEKATALIFTEKGKIEEYNIASKIKIDGETLKDADEIIEALSSEERTDLNKDSGAVTYPCSQMIKYTLNSNGDLNEVLTSAAKSGDMTISTNLILDVGLKSAKYNSSTKMLSTTLVSTSTKVFFIPTKRSNEDEYGIGTYSTLVSSRTYNYEVYDVSNGKANVLVVYGDSGIEVNHKLTPTVVVTKISEVKGTDGAVNQLTCMEDGTSKTYKTTDLSVLDGVNIGDVLKIKTNKKSEIEEVMVLYKPKTDWLFTYGDVDDDDQDGDGQRFVATDGAYVTDAKVQDLMSADFLIARGTVAQKHSDVLMLSLCDVELDDDDKPTLDTDDVKPLAYNSSTAVYKYSAKDEKITKDTVANAVVDFENARDKASKVYLYSKDGIVKFIITLVD